MEGLCLYCQTLPNNGEKACTSEEAAMECAWLSVPQRTRRQQRMAVIRSRAMKPACSHDVSDMDMATQADGLCPLCQQTEINRLRVALHTIFCNTEPDAIPHPSYDILAQNICDCAAAALGYENGKPTIEQVASIMELREMAGEMEAPPPRSR